MKIEAKKWILIICLSCFFIANSFAAVYIAKVEGYVINPVVEKYLINAINTSYNNNADCLIICLDTPGGLLESTRNIVRNLLNARIPVVVYVSPSGARATSAGVFITASAHIAAMADSTHIGAAHPVNIGFKGLKDVIDDTNKKDGVNVANENDKNKTLPKINVSEFITKTKTKSVMEEKILNDTIAWVESISENRNRNKKLLVRFVKDSVSITEKEALKNNVIDIIAKDIYDLIDKIHGHVININGKEKKINIKDKKIIDIKLNPIEKFLNAISNPNVAYILMILGIIGLVFEFSHPGIGFPGIAGFICLLLAFFSFNMMPFNYVGLILIIFSLIMFIAEFFTPVFGLLTLGGVISFILGSMILIDSPISFFKISITLILIVSLFVVMVFVFVIYKVFKVHRTKSQTGKDGLIGQVAKVTSVINPEGRVYVHGELWTAISLHSDMIEEGCEVCIVKVDGLKLIVQEK